MSRYENIQCPVCKNFFDDGDDIVVCPDCGTPHHRECYNYVGHCVNQGLHQSGYKFTETQKVKSITQSVQEQMKDIPLEKKAVNVIPVPPMPGLSPLYTSDTDTIEGESVGDVAATVRSNIPRFVNVFKKIEKNKKKLTWNWGAFFFGSLYFFYRKLFRHAVSLIALFTAILVGSDLAIVKLAPKCAEIIQETALTITPQNRMDVSGELYEKLTGVSDFSVLIIIFISFFAAIFVLRVAEALLADKIYKKAICALIKRVRLQISEGASFSTNIPDADEANLSQEQMKRYYLASKGGVSIFAPAMAFLVLQMLLRII